MLKENEKWLDSYEGKYSINTLGEVFSWKRGRRITNLKLIKTSTGYYNITLYDTVTRTHHPQQVARLMLMAFMVEDKSTINRFMVVRYKDNDKSNLKLDNLYLQSRVELNKSFTNSGRRPIKTIVTNLTTGEKKEFTSFTKAINEMKLFVKKTKKIKILFHKNYRIEKV